MATPFIIKQGSKNDLPTTYESGALYFCTDTKEIYMDTTDDASGRICITNQNLETKITNIQTQLNNKATSSTTLAGYGITNAYTKTEVENYVANQIGAFLNSSS